MILFFNCVPEVSAKENLSLIHLKSRINFGSGFSFHLFSGELVKSGLSLISPSLISELVLMRTKLLISEFVKMVFNANHIITSFQNIFKDDGKN
jgi:hypothetical protein